MSTNISTIRQEKSIAELLVGENVNPVTFYIEDGQLQTIEYPIDRFAQDDDGYYLVNSNFRVPLHSIVSVFDYNIGHISLELENEYLTKRELVK